VAARLRTGAGVVGSEMSGGMDSTTVTALARGLLQQAGKKHVVFSFVFPTMKECNESPFIDQLADSLGLDLHRLDGEDSGVFDYPCNFLPSPETPAAVRNPLHAAIAERLAGLGGRVLLTGNGGDEFMWGTPLTYGFRFWRGDIRAFWEIVQFCRSRGFPVWPNLRSVLISPYVPESIKHWIRALRTGGRVPRWPAWLPEQARVRLDLSTRRPPSMPRGLNLPQREIYDKSVSSLIRAVPDLYSYSIGTLGVEARHPFLDRRVAEFVFAVPVELWLRGPWPKWLLRQATEGLLADSVRWRAGKTVFSTCFAAGINRNRAWVEDVLSDPGLQGLGLIDNATLVARFRSALADGQQKAARREILWPLATQCWVQQCRRVFGFSVLRGGES
jgi:asparagine synthetase B (glutamine-hydrolysing)